MRTYEEDPFDPNPEWKDWVLTLLTVKDVIVMPQGLSVGGIALIEAEVLASSSEGVKPGEITTDRVPLGQDTSFWHSSDNMRKYTCLDRGAEVRVGASFFVATYFQDGPNGRSRAAVTSQWKA